MFSVKKSAPANVDYIVRPSGPLRGEIRVPGDKSISHRCIMLGAVADGDTRVRGLLEGEDVLATVAAFRSLGVEIDGPEDGEAVVHGVGREGLRAPAAAIDLGNSGTAMRLLAGLLAGQGFDCTLVGDASLNRRPMRRITEPLARMGARIETADGGTPPLVIRARDGLAPIGYTTPVASAQVKSSILLAGLYANGRTSVTEAVPTRDHTERMLAAFGAALTREDASTREGLPSHERAPAGEGSRVRIEGGRAPRRHGDRRARGHLLRRVPSRGGSGPPRFGSARPWCRGEPHPYRNTGHPRADGSGHLAIEPSYRRGEPVADLRVRGAMLHGVDVAPALVPPAIDEFPAVFAAAATARGATRVTGAGELRVKESDRLAVSAAGLAALGVRARTTGDGGMVIEGGTMSGGEVDSAGDHRIAMAFATAAAAAPVRIRDCRNVATSFPGFRTLANSVGLDVEVVDAGG